MVTSIRARGTCAFAVCVCLSAAPGSTRTASAEDIVFESAPATVLPGQTFSFLTKLLNNTTPLVAYALDVNIVPEPGFLGSVSARLEPNAPWTNFYVSENLIANAPGGGALHATSSITGGGAGDVDIVALSDDFFNVDPAGPGHDVLAELVFDVSGGASGFFTIELGETGTSLTTRIGTGTPPDYQPVPYDFDPVTIQVVPEPGGLALLVGACLLVRCRRRGRPGNWQR